MTIAAPVQITSSSDAVARVLDAIVARVPLTRPLLLRHDGAMLALCDPETGEAGQSLPLPIHPARLAEALLKYDQATPAELPITFDHGWVFHPPTRSLVRAGAQQQLTEKEAALLRVLWEAHPAPCMREALLRDVWHHEAMLETHTLETHIYRLRSKLEGMGPSPCHILTTEGGYQLQLS